MTEAVILSAVEKLQRLVIDESAEGHVKGLIHDLNCKMLPVIQNYVRRGNEFQDAMILQFREMAHDADVAIDTFILLKDCVEINPRRRRDRLLTYFGKVHHQSLQLKQFCDQIDSIRKSLRHKSALLLMEQLRSPLTSNIALPRRSTPIPIPESEVVGLKEDVELLLRRAIFKDVEEANFMSLCIVGMGGVGKTTLAALVWNHERVASEFEIRAWVCVGGGDNESMKVLVELSRVLGIKSEENADRDVLVERILRRLNGIRYLIVFDDVWHDKHMDILLSQLYHHGTPSRVLVTTRNRKLIHSAYIHEVKILDANDSWKLFMKRVLRDGQTKCPNHLEKIGRKILRKCDGLPLAINEVGTQLSTKGQSLIEWENFLESIDFSVILEVLDLSFKNMFYELKRCFLSLAFFKEGTTIRVGKLLQVWATGGMISLIPRYESQTVEEVGTTYFPELVSQHMVQSKDMSADYSRVKTCFTNDNLHRLAVARAKDEISFDILRNDQDHRLSHKPRHRVVCSSRETINYYAHQDQNLVSLFFHGGGNFDDSPHRWRRFKLLKILDFEGFGLKTLPEIVGELVSLKFLGLRSNFIQELPRSLGHLKRLEVLDIALNFMVEVPNTIFEIISLRHLYMSDYIISGNPFKIDALEIIHTLTYISVDDLICNLPGLQTMNSLCKLGIGKLDGTSNISKILASLANLMNLDWLILKGCPFRRMPSLDELGSLHRLTKLKLDGLLTKLPSADSFPPNISHLTLVSTSLDQDPMPVLEKLPKLVFLKLKNAYAGEQMIISNSKFARLKVLCIQELWHLRNFKVGKGSMQDLKRLEIKNCPYMEMMVYPSKANLANLAELDMVTTKDVARRMSKSGLMSKIGHVDIQP